MPKNASRFPPLSLLSPPILPFLSLRPVNLRPELTPWNTTKIYVAIGTLAYHSTQICEASRRWRSRSEMVLRPLCGPVIIAKPMTGTRDLAAICLYSECKLRKLNVQLARATIVARCCSSFLIPVVGIFFGAAVFCRTGWADRRNPLTTDTNRYQATVLDCDSGCAHMGAIGGGLEFGKRCMSFKPTGQAV